MQCLRQREQLEIEVEASRVWCPKKKADELGTSTDVNMVFFLPAEYQNQAEGEDEEEVAAHLVLHPQQA